MSPEDISKDEIRKRLGGYATGTLTDAERKALFAAALNDQELFDELGREQSLKELLDSPGARTRLTAALAPPAKVTMWWKSPLPWALAGTLAVAVLVVFVVARAPRPLETAALKIAPQETRARLDQPAPARQERDQPAKTTRPEPSAAPAPQPQSAAQQTETKRREAVSTGVAAESPLLAPQAVQPAQPALKKEEAAKTDSLGPAASDKALTDQKDARPPVQAMTQAGQSQVPSGVGIREQQLAATNSAAPTAAAAPRAAAPASLAGSSKPRLAFDYTLRRDNLTVRPLATGFLLVTAFSSGGREVVLQPASRLESGTSVSIGVPAGSTTVTATLSPNAPTRDVAADRLAGTGALTMQRAAKAVSKSSVSKEVNGRAEESPADRSASVTLAVPPE